MGIAICVPLLIVERNNEFVVNFLDYTFIYLFFLFIDYLCGGDG